MAFSHGINGAAPATGSVAMWTVIQMLIAAGATKVADSDGTTYSASGLQVTSGASGAGGLGNNSAWARLLLPGGREVTFQRGTTNTTWRIKYSAQAGFVGGSPGATQTPTATDQAIRTGGGTDASPTFVNLLSTDNSYKLYGCADSATGGFWYAGAANSNGAQVFGFILDPLSAATVDDDEPTAIIVAASGATFASGTLGNSGADATGSGAMAWLKYGLAGATFLAMPVLTFGGWPNNAGQNQHTSKELLRLVEYERVASLGGVTGQKGTSGFVAWNASSRTAKELYLVGANYRICFGDVNLPFLDAAVL